MSNERRDKSAQKLLTQIAEASVYFVGHRTCVSWDKAPDLIAAALDRYAEGLREDVLREAARAVCPYDCGQGNWPTFTTGGLNWHHGSSHCEAFAIHDLIAAMQAEDGGETTD